MADMAPGAGRPLRIGFAVCDPGLSFGAIVVLGAKERALELGVELTAVSVSKPSEQARVIRAMAHDGLDAVIVEALESQIVVPALQELEAAGIPIVIADMGIPAVRAACTVRSDNVGGAQLAAAYLVDRLHGQGKLAHLRGLPTSENGIERTRGLHNVVDRRPGIEVVFEGPSDWTREAGAELMRKVLARHPDVQAVFAGNDPLALGAVDAIAQAGRTGEIIVAGFDALPDALLAIEHGSMGATVRQAPRSMGRLAVEMAVRAARGEQLPDVVATEVALVTQDEVAEASLAALPLFPRILRDLTDSNSALAEERSLLRTLVDNLPDLIFIKDRDSRFVLANPSLVRLVGASSSEQMIGKSDFDFFPPELAAHGEVFVINVKPGISTTDLRAKGFEEEAKALGLDYIGEQFSQNEPAIAASEMEATLARHPGLKGVFGTNLFAAEGAATGLRNFGRAGQVKIVAFDAGPAQVAQLRQGLVQALIAQEPYQEGIDAVRTAVAALEGKPVQRKQTTGVVTVTRANLAGEQGALYKSSCS